MTISNHQIIKGSGVVALVLTLYQAVTLLLSNASWIWLLVLLFLITPCVLVVLLARKVTYNTKLKAICRSVSGILVSAISVFSFIALSQASDPMVGVLVLYMAGVQYLALFFAEAIIRMSILIGT